MRLPELIYVRPADAGTWEVEDSGGSVQYFRSREVALFEAQEIAKAEKRMIAIEGASGQDD